MYLAVLVLTSCITTIHSQFGSDKASLQQNPCVSKTNCGSCIQTPKCAWCMQPDFGERPRCFQPDLRPTVPCPEEFTVDPGNEQEMIRAYALSRNGEILSGGEMASGGSVSGHESGQHSESGGFSESGGSKASGGMAGSSGAGAVQISPQHVNLKLRISKKRIGD